MNEQKLMPVASVENTKKRLTFYFNMGRAMICSRYNTWYWFLFVYKCEVLCGSCGMVWCLVCMRVRLHLFRLVQWNVYPRRAQRKFIAYFDKSIWLSLWSFFAIFFFLYLCRSSKDVWYTICSCYTISNMAFELIFINLNFDDKIQEYKECTK